MAEKQNTEKQSAFKELVLPVIVLVVMKAYKKRHAELENPKEDDDENE